MPLQFHLMKSRVGVKGNTQLCTLLCLGGLQDSIQPHHAFTDIICTIVDAYLDYKASLGLTDMLSKWGGMHTFLLKGSLYSITHYKEIPSCLVYHCLLEKVTTLATLLLFAESRSNSSLG